MVKLLVLSDLRVEFAPFEPDAAAVAAADVVVLAGDIHKGVRGIEWARAAFADKPIIYVAGNHEFYSHHWTRLLDKMHEVAKEQEVHFLENQAVEICGVRFLWLEGIGVNNPNPIRAAMISAALMDFFIDAKKSLRKLA
jgi:predicted phosphodiesterase